MQNYFKKIFKKPEEKKKFMFTTNNLAQPTGNGNLIRREGGDRYAQNILTSGSYYSIDSILQATTNQSNPVSSIVGSPVPEKNPEDIRKEAEPKAVFNEIKREPLDISFENLGQKIEGVEERIEILSEHLDQEHLQDEHRALFYLRNRQKYMETRKNNPIDWAMTTQEAVDDLCKTYKLKVVPLKQYYTLVPTEGVKEIKRYTKAYKAITGDEPIFELVIKDNVKPKEDEKKPEQKRKDRDPILLANSPLGNHMFILGAWDEEVEIVDEIIYYGK